jgi:hypothetical protein
MSNGGVSIISIVSDSGLSEEAKLYFKNALVSVEKDDFAESKNIGKKTLDFNNNYFNELMKLL